ncbi:N-6 DNA methylase, partial [Methanospirillum sp.]|uniref:Eco57I restriction-modification methylase domain-containing protein n=1 Tax=Methanospirillum sp. TaxID=45200 RepID=UPI002BC1644A
VENLRLATSYIIVNQLLFYQILSKKKNLPEIDSSKLRSSSELQEYFNRVLEINYRFIYSYDVVSKVPDLFLGDLKKIISAIQGLNPEKVGGDLLGTIFHDLIPFEVRKIVAAFYTNPLAADMLASLAIESPYVSVVDFAAGSGGLLVSAYHSKKRLIEDFSEEDHRKFLESEIYGVDIMPFAANVAASHLALQSPEYFTNKVNIAIWDSTELKEGDVIPTLAGIDYVLRGQTSLNMFGGDSKIDAKGVVKLGISTPDDIRLPKFDVIIMNPPFTRQEKIPKNYKDVLDSRFEDYKTIISGQMGYHGYFILLADRFAKQDGVIALVLPATILRIKSFEGIRDLIKEQYSVKYLITSIFRSAFSESTRLREILLIAVKKKTNSSYMTKIVTLKKLPENHDDALILADKIKNYSELNDESMIIEKIDYSSFISTKNWFKFIVLNNKDLYSFYQQFEQHPKLIRISESNFKIKRGFELEKGLLSSLIILSNRDNASRQNDIWILNKQTKNSYHALHKSGTVEFKIPKNCVQFALRRASGLNKIIVDDTLDYIITTSWSKGDFRKFQESLGKQFQSKLLDKIKRNVDNRLGNLYIVRRFNISAPNTFALAYYSSILAAPTKLLYSVNLPDSDAIILTSYFNSVFNLLQVLIERVETEGAFLELSEYVLDDFMIPNLSELSESEKILIIENFKNIGNKPLESIYEQLKHGREYRIQLDEIWKTILGIDVDLNSLYRCIIKEINLLKNIMKN